MTDRPLRLGLRENWRQFSLLVAVVGFVGAMIGLERSLLPLLGQREFGLQSNSVILSFLISFGITKAVMNWGAGALADRLGRKAILIIGWLAAIPVPFLIYFAPSWSWVIAANLLLGVNQGLCWSLTVIMKIDLVGPRQRGLGMGLNEASGYVSVALSAFGGAALAERVGLRAPFLWLGLVFALAGLVLSAFARETRGHVRLEEMMGSGYGASSSALSLREVAILTSWRDRTLFGASQAGLINNLNDAAAFGLLPLLLAQRGIDLAGIGLLSAIYPATWGLLQVLTGGLSDRIGRKLPIVTGMVAQALGLAAVAAFDRPIFTAFGLIVLGLGTALVYPTLIATVSDKAAPAWRASSVGVYRFWRDMGYAFGGIVAGTLADRVGIPSALLGVAVATLLSGLLCRAVMEETLPTRF
jgi:MFS family permease